MSTPLHSASPFNPAELARVLAAAPHRLLFLGGATAVLLSMLWWAAWLLAQRSGWFALPPPALPAGWAHAIGMQYQALPMFMFGFLLTVFPRWIGLPAYRRRHYIPVGASLLLGYLAFHIGLLGVPVLVHAGVVLTLLGYLIGLSLLLRLLWLDGGRTWHAIACWSALALGFVGLLLAARFLHGGDARALFAAIKIGTFGLLLPVFLTVCHRMLPFFSHAVTPGYQIYRPAWVLATMLALIFAHLLLELAHAYAWLWLVDVPLAALAALLAWRWRSNAARRVRLLLVLHWGFAWLPIAFALYALQSAWFAASGEFAFGRAPVHALTVGYFGSLLVAMVTRVTQGHSGRPLEMGRIPWVCFVLLQIVVVVRIAAEALPDAPMWLAISAIGWVLAFLPWVLRSAWIYLTPRLDGNAG
jgi:uncharacterized protein involved in response to NO